MKTLFAGLAMCLAVSAAGAASTEPTEKDAIAMSNRAAALIKAQGKEELIKKITARDPAFVRGSMYVYLRDFKTGVNTAHPFNQALIGKDMNEVPDTNGKFYRRDIMEMANKEGKGWVDYMYKNPTNGKVESKTAYVMKVDDVVLVTGIYKQ